MARENPEVTVLGGWEENEAARKRAEEWGVRFPYESYEALLCDTRVDLVILCDCYGKRGRQAIQALTHGKRVLADKPLCTRMEELNEIERLARETGLAVGCMLPLRHTGYARIAREIAQSGEWGRLRAAMFTGQHPLMAASRPEWYFEPGMQGGTITDIAAHGVDFIRFVTGQEMERVEYARTWNAFAKNFPDFRDCAQLAYRLEGGAGVMGDVSYASPDSFGYTLDSYWRFELWLDGGKIVCGENLPEVTLYKNGETEPSRIPKGSPEGDCLCDILANRGSEDVLSAMRTVLALQRAAEEAGA